MHSRFERIDMSGSEGYKRCLMKVSLLVNVSFRVKVAS